MAINTDNDIVKVYQDAHHEWRWRRIDQANGKIVSISGDGYDNREYAIEAAHAYNPDLEVLEATSPE